MRKWIYKFDAAGKPRRFLDHREAALWALMTTGKVFGALALYWLLNSIFYTFRDGELAGAVLTLVPAAVMVAAWLLVSAVLYLYLVLSGGVMDDEARRRYRNNETLRSRW